MGRGPGTPGSTATSAVCSAGRRYCPPDGRYFDQDAEEDRPYYNMETLACQCQPQDDSDVIFLRVSVAGLTGGNRGTTSYAAATEDE